MNSKKKVLIVNDPLQYGGSDLVAVRLQQNLNKDKFECVYCLRYDKTIGPMEPQIAATGVRIIHQPDNRLGYLDSYKYYLELFKREKFDIVHCHLPFYSGIVFLAAKKSGINKRVAHSHFSQPLIYGSSKIKKLAGEIYRRIMRKVIAHYATDIIGCSQEAGEYLAGKKGFSKKGIVLNNGIDAYKYEFNVAARNEARKNLGIENKTVIGHIGQMYYVKNHKFLIDVFYEYQKTHKDSVLLLVSDGPDRNKLEEKVKGLNIEEKVLFLGFRDDIPNLLFAMDCFVFPSIHEGFPLTLVEAQAAKLPCLVSESITKKVKYNDNFEFLSINQSTKLWCNKIDELLKYDRSSVDNSLIIEQFDIKNIAKKLEQIYSS